MVLEEVSQFNLALELTKFAIPAQKRNRRDALGRRSCWHHIMVSTVKNVENDKKKLLPPKETSLRQEKLTYNMPNNEAKG